MISLFHFSLFLELGIFSLKLGKHILFAIAVGTKHDLIFVVKTLVFK